MSFWQKIPLVNRRKYSKSSSSIVEDNCGVGRSSAGIKKGLASVVGGKKFVRAKAVSNKETRFSASNTADSLCSNTSNASSILLYKNSNNNNNQPERVSTKQSGRPLNKTKSPYSKSSSDLLSQSTPINKARSTSRLNTRQTISATAFHGSASNTSLHDLVHNLHGVQVRSDEARGKSYYEQFSAQARIPQQLSPPGSSTSGTYSSSQHTNSQTSMHGFIDGDIAKPRVRKEVRLAKLVSKIPGKRSSTTSVDSNPAPQQAARILVAKSAFRGDTRLGQVAFVDAGEHLEIITGLREQSYSQTIDISAFTNVQSAFNSQMRGLFPKSEILELVQTINNQDHSERRRSGESTIYEPLSIRNLDGSIKVHKSNSAGFDSVERVESIRSASGLWLHGSLSRTDCENILSGYCAGAFLIRAGTQDPSEKVLCVQYNSQVQHYKIRKFTSLPENSDNTTIHGCRPAAANPPLFSIDQEEYFYSLEILVFHYQSDADGLCCKLTFPVVAKEIPNSCVKFGEELGSGEFSQVFSATFDGVSENLAVKSCIVQDRWQEANLLREANTHLLLGKHQNIIEIYGVSYVEFDENARRLSILLKNLTNGSLQDVLRSQGRRTLNNRILYGFAVDCCTALDFVVSRHSIIHRDVASRNVLVSDSGVAKLADFGMAVPLSAITKDYQLNATVTALTPKKPTIDSNKLPIRWIAPEAFNSHRFSEQSDVWSFGILIWEIFTFARIPYGRASTRDLIDRIQGPEQLRCAREDGIPDEIYNLAFCHCWTLDSTKRLRFHQLLGLIKKFNLDLVLKQNCFKRLTF